MHLLSTLRLAPIPSANHRALLSPPVPSGSIRLRPFSESSARSPAPLAVSPAGSATVDAGGSATGVQSVGRVRGAGVRRVIRLRRGVHRGRRPRGAAGERGSGGVPLAGCAGVRLADAVPHPRRPDRPVRAPLQARPPAPHRGLRGRRRHRAHLPPAPRLLRLGVRVRRHGLLRRPATVLEMEHCIVHPDNREVRVRLVQTVALAKEARLRGVKVFSEQWYGPFHNGDQLGGCALRETGFAAGERLSVSEVVGQWESTAASAARFSGELDPATGKFAGLAPDEPRRSLRDEAGVVTLPKQLWSSFSENGDDEVVCEVGWVLGHGTAVTSRCVLSKDGDVKEIAAAYESRVPDGT